MKISVILLASLLTTLAYSQTVINVNIDTETQYQTVEGFGASLAYYEGWLTAHPNKSDVYDAIFGELSLDILRYRNAYDYDSTMIDRAKEFYDAAENVLGHPIKVLSTSWGPPAYLKSNNDRKNGGSLKYTINEGNVEFDYTGFANWWSGALDEYNSENIFPTYISLQNEPDYDATWESCLFKPTETINSTDTIAGYNKALEAIYNMVQQRDIKPKILGPETIGIGYNSTQNYMNALNTDYLDGICHHLYHGVDEDNPWISSEFTKVGNLYPEIPHYQSEYSRGDWYSLGGLMHKSFHDENVVAYLYWDLIWDGAGLVDLEFPWDQNRWTADKGFIKTKEFYAFKQYSAFIHPEWIRINSTTSNENVKTLAFINPALDSISLVLVNRSLTNSSDVSISISDFGIDTSFVYRTSETENCEYMGEVSDSVLTLPQKSITTVQMNIGEVINTSIADQVSEKVIIYPNPVSDFAIIQLPANTNYDYVSIIDAIGRIVKSQSINSDEIQNQKIMIDCRGFSKGLYYFKMEAENSGFVVRRFIVN